MIIKKVSRSVTLALLASTATASSYAFTVDSIQFEGLNNIPRSTVLASLPVHQGENLSSKQSDQVISQLFQTGFFDNIELFRQGKHTLVVKVDERPTIADVTFSGNKMIKKENLQKVLQNVGITSGEIFSESTLSQLKQSLEHEYISLGKYAVRVKVKVSHLPRNRVALHIKISEGLDARVARINIVGNHDFKSSTLRKQLALTTPGFWTFFTGSDKYKQQLMQKSVQALTEFYQDRGYLNFHINSHVVSIDPTRRKVFITLSVHEGDKYKFSGYKLAGHLVLPQSTAEQLIKVKAGDHFSRQAISKSRQGLEDKLKNMGYAFATVNTIPDIDKDNKTVGVTFAVAPGHKVTINNITFKGNTVTRDRTLRERLKYVEDSPYSGKAMSQSKLALDQLPYLQNINPQTEPVAGSPDQLNVNYNVTEKAANSVSANIGYSELNKFLIGGKLNMPNVFGSGNAFDINAQFSRPYQSLNFGFTQPYFTIDGVSQSFNLYLTRVDNSKRNLTNFSTNSVGGSVNYGIPISTWNTLNIGAGFDHTKLLQPKSDTSATVSEFTKDNGSVFNTFTLNLGWSHDTTNNAFFPTKGVRANAGGTIAVPGSKMTWYKLRSSFAWYHPLFVDGYTISINGGAGFGNGYGRNSHLPFFNNFYGGGWGGGNGFGRVRGFSAGSLGPSDKLCDNDSNGCSKATAGNSIGGNLVVDASINLFFPVPFADNQDDFRMGVFMDAGNVYLTYNTDTIFTEGRNNPRSPNSSNLRYSTGVSFEWRSPFGPLAFSISEPFNKKPGDDTRMFQFTLGQTF